MKSYLMISLLMTFATTGFAKEIFSDNQEAMIHVARIVGLVNLGAEENLQTEGDIYIKVIVVDLGSATDFSPTKKIFFALYRANEMFSLDAAFDLGNYTSFISAEPITDRHYKLIVHSIDDESSIGIAEEEYIIDASKAIQALQSVDCGDNFDCEAARNFKTSIFIRKSATP